MTARSKKQRQRNAAIKREKQKVKELARLRKTVGLPEMMDTDTVTPVDNITTKVNKSFTKLIPYMILFIYLTFITATET